MIAVLLAAAILLALASMVCGASTLGARDAVQWLSGSADASVDAIFRYIRLPRTLACLLVGSALAAAGLLLQTALNNPLASPGVIGVNAGSGLFVVAASILFPSVFWVRGLAALGGALAAALWVYALARRGGASRVTIILAGVAISSLLAAGMDAIVTLYPTAIMDRTAFFIGGFSSIYSGALLVALPFLLAGFLGAAFLAGRLDLLLLGDEVAASLGLHVERTRFLAILFAAALAAGAVSIAGLVGFVGLIVPHMVRRLTGGALRRSLPVTILLGGCLVLGCDLLARLLFAPYEVPAGILLSLIGAPFFLYLILNRRKHRYDTA
ncbi:MAG: iron ABC transporter permease [Anaerolineae bacterium]|nr:iron ABC transporter permease [Anaerolineae bacterium]